MGLWERVKKEEEEIVVDYSLEVKQKPNKLQLLLL